MNAGEDSHILHMAYILHSLSSLNSTLWSVWYQMTPVCFLSRHASSGFFNRVMFDWHESKGRAWVWAACPSLLSTISSFSERQLHRLRCHFSTFILRLISAWLLTLHATKLLVVQDSSLQASLPERYNDADWFHQQCDEVIVAPSIFSK